MSTLASNPLSLMEYCDRGCVSAALAIKAPISETLRSTVSRSTIFLALGGLLCLLAIVTIDGPVAHLFSKSTLYMQQKDFAVGAPLLLIPVVLMTVCCAAFILLARRLSQIAETIITAGISAFVGFVFNNFGLKPVFGRQNVEVFLYHPQQAGFFPFEGNWKASFPSGHMVIVASILTIVW